MCQKKNEELEIDLSYSENSKASLQKWFNSCRGTLSVFKVEPKDDPYKVERIEKDENTFFCIPLRVS